MEGLTAPTHGSAAPVGHHSANRPVSPTRSAGTAQRELWNRALQLHRAERLEEAIVAYRALLEIGSQSNAAVWINLAVALRTQKKFLPALVCCRRGLEIKPDDPGALSTFGNVLKDLKRLPEAISAHRQAVARRPDDPSLRNNLAVAYRELGELEKALAEWDVAAELDPESHRYRLERAFALLYLGRFDEGWPAFEARWSTGELVEQFEPVPRWQGERFDGKTLVVYPEQGFGDAILAARFLPMVKSRGGTVVLVCKGPLYRLFSKLDGVDELVLPGESEDGSRFDLRCPMMSLPGIFGASPNTLPPPATLHVPEDARAKAASILSKAGKRLNVGVVWSGSVTFANNHNRAVSVDRFLELAEITGVQLFSLQKGPLEHQLAHSGADAVMVDVGARVDNFADTAAVIAQLDLVIMTDSSVAHLCGSMGKPIWNLLNFVPYWLYQLNGDRTPWYPSMRLYRQPRPGDWESVFRRVSMDLNELAT